jgi:hypothetical protein
MTAPMQLCAPIGKYREPGGRQYSEFRRRVAEGKAVKRSATSRGELGSPSLLGNVRHRTEIRVIEVLASSETLRRAGLGS